MINEREQFNGEEEAVPDPDEFKYLHPIEDDSDTLEPLPDESEFREINADDPEDLLYWADQFQISVADLKAAIVINGNEVREIKRYLSV
mgnify:CR=1 FL=1|jgi:hypothetical protein